jgi:hypothetical protein
MHQEAAQNEAWDLILDKGISNAIALVEKDDNGRIQVEGFLMTAYREALKSGRTFVNYMCVHLAGEIDTHFKNRTL